MINNKNQYLHIAPTGYNPYDITPMTKNKQLAIVLPTAPLISYQSFTDDESYSDVFVQVALALQQFIDDESYSEVFIQVSYPIQQFVDDESYSQTLIQGATAIQLLIDDESYSEVFIQAAQALQIFIDDEQYSETVVFSALILQFMIDSEIYTELVVFTKTQFALINTTISEVKPHMGISTDKPPQMTIGINQAQELIIDTPNPKVSIGKAVIPKMDINIID